MREVSMRMMHMMIDLARTGGVDERALTAGLTSTRASNGKEPAWIDWDDFVEVVERLERMLGGPLAFGRTVRAAAPIAYPEFRAVAAIFLHPIPTFEFVITRLMRTMYRHMEVASMEHVRENVVSWELVIPEPYRASEVFLRTSVPMIETFPTHLDLPEATVEVVNLGPRAAKFVATFPASSTLSARGLRAVSAATSSLAAQLDEAFTPIAEAVRAKPVRLGDATPVPMPKRAIKAWATSLDLSPRQVEVFSLLIEGRANKDIATEMQCSERNVEFHVGRILRAAHVNSRSELLVKVLRSVA